MKGNILETLEIQLGHLLRCNLLPENSYLATLEDIETMKAVAINRTGSTK